MAKSLATEATVPTPSAEYTVVARRYRPQQFAELIGQEHVARALVNALESGRVAHAYLFTGARGVGKTSAARILAKALNCVKGPTATPCDVCDCCKGVAAGEDVDVLEIDGASNNKVEEIRDLRQNVGFRPTRSRFKIYIIDEVHMLTSNAFNALLKTLDEPSPHVKFIFATTAPANADDPDWVKAITPRGNRPPQGRTVPHTRRLSQTGRSGYDAVRRGAGERVPRRR